MRDGTRLPPVFDDGWLDSYAVGTARLKRRDPDEVRALVTEAHQTFYRLVALDVDGTLTEPGKTTLDDRMIEIVAGLLRRSVPVVLMTGRGRGGARTAANELRERSGLDPELLRRLSVVTHNGVFWLRTPRERPESFLVEQQLISPPWEKEKWEGRARQALDSLEPINARFSIEPETLRIQTDPGDLEKVREAMVELARDAPDVYVASGLYGEHGGVEIGTAQKGRAVARLAHELGIRTEQVLRIGDQGEDGGNDYELLDSPAGFSVGTYSRNSGSCVPVLADDLTTQLVGAEATRTLLGRVLLLPSLSLSPPEPRDALLALSEFGRRAELQARREARAVDQRFRLRLTELMAERRDPLIDLDVVALSDVFDPRSGAVRFRDWEIERLDPDCRAQALFQFPRLEAGRTQAPQSQWSMYTDTAIVARGPLYYFGETRPTEERQVDGWVRLVDAFTRDAFELVQDLSHQSFDFAGLKLVAAVQDNIRNFLLQLVWMEMNEEREELAQAHAREVFTALVGHAASQIELLFDPDREWRSLLGRYLQTLDPFVSILRRIVDDPPRVRDDIKAFKTRECDFFVENLMAVQIGMRRLRAAQNLASEDPLLCVGLANGGIELPAIAVADGQARGYDVIPAALRVSRYSSGADTSLIVRGAQPDYVHELIGRAETMCTLGAASDPVGPGATTIVMDDNCTTCTTLQLARDILAVGGYDVRGAVVVRTPGINRQVQMAMPDHGFPDPDILFGFIRGLVAPSPYARLVRPVYPPEDKRQYLDELDTFNKAERRLQGYLEKNGTPEV